MFRSVRPALTAVVFVSAFAAWLHAQEPAGKPAAAEEVKFATHRIGTFRSEACGVADYNADGQLDVIAGPYVYLAPDWKAIKIRTLPGSVDEQGKGYYDDFMNLPLDVDGDGKPDVASCGWFSKSVTWYRNTLGQVGEWPLAQEVIDSNYECGDLGDIDGDGQAVEILAHTPATLWFEAGTLSDGKRGLVKHVVSDKPMPFGGGVGDVNADGHPDILRPTAWFEAPADPRKGVWIEHSWEIGLGAKDGKADHTPQVLVHDVDGDGLQDVVTSSAHAYGIWWYKQTSESGRTRWEQCLIDDSWTQAHSLALGDLNGDGVADLVSGKRFMAHNGSDPDESGKLCVYWYELRRGPQPQWIRHVVSYDEGIGSGMNVWLIDMDRDGDLDIVTTGKWGGPVLFKNTRIGKTATRPR
jgi:hypothetical protein